ncbi:hypothetical protein Tco_1126952 [Tanacetum coccineum]
MANIRTCNKHNMIACVEKTAQNADFYQIIDFLTGCSINYSLLVDPDLIGPWLQQFWATASLKVINDVPHIRAKVAGKKILISEATIRADLLFDDENGVEFSTQVLAHSSTYCFIVTRYRFLSKVLLTPKDAEIPVKLGRNKDEGTLSEEHYVQEEDTADPFFEDIADKDRLKNWIWRQLKSNARQGTITPRPLNLKKKAGPSIPLHPIQVMESEEQLKAAEVLCLYFRQRALETTNDEEVARKIQAEWDAEEERKRFEELKKTKPKTTLRKPTSPCSRKDPKECFLKSQDTKICKNLRIHKMKNCMTKFKHLLKTPTKNLFQWNQRRKGIMKEREAKKILRKRKATISEEQPSKKPKLRTETIDELRNYLRVVY